MAKLDKRARYNQFSKVGDKFCIGGSEIFHIWKGDTGMGIWTWYCTQITTKNKIPSTYYGYVQGVEAEWGSWYASHMKGMQEIPKEEWSEVIELSA